jgi:hypothetical protein
MSGSPADAANYVREEQGDALAATEAAAAATGSDVNGQPTSAVAGEDPTGLRQERVVVRALIQYVPFTRHLPTTRTTHRACLFVQVKFLIPNVAAGSIIGKGGSNITEIQSQSGARMQVSRKTAALKPSGVLGKPAVCSPKDGPFIASCHPVYVGFPRVWATKHPHPPLTSIHPTLFASRTRSSPSPTSFTQARWKARTAFFSSLAP